MARARQHLKRQQARAEVALENRAEKKRRLIIIFFIQDPLTIRKERFEPFLAGVKVSFVFFDSDKRQSHTGARLAGWAASHKWIADRPRIVGEYGEKVLKQLDRLFCCVVAVFHLWRRLFKVTVGVFVRRAVKRAPKDKFALILKRALIGPAVLFVPWHNAPKADRRHLNDDRVYRYLSPIRKYEHISRRV